MDRHHPGPWWVGCSEGDTVPAQLHGNTIKIKNQENMSRQNNE